MRCALNACRYLPSERHHRCRFSARLLNMSRHRPLFSAKPFVEKRRDRADKATHLSLAASVLSRRFLSAEVLSLASCSMSDSIRVTASRNCACCPTTPHSKRVRGGNGNRRKLASQAQEGTYHQDSWHDTAIRWVDSRRGTVVTQTKKMDLTLREGTAWTVRTRESGMMLVHFLTSTHLTLLPVDIGQLQASVSLTQVVLKALRQYTTRRRNRSFGELPIKRPS